MDPLTFFVIVGGVFFIFDKLDCSSKEYKCNSCGHCFDTPEAVGYDFCYDVCPRCRSRNISRQK